MWWFVHIWGTDRCTLVIVFVGLGPWCRRWELISRTKWPAPGHHENFRYVWLNRVMINIWDIHKR